MKPVSPSASYWDAILGSFVGSPGQKLWRECSDAIYFDLIHNWLGTDRRWERVLKTDLFDEAVREGLVPRLSTIAGEVHGIDISLAVKRAAQTRYSSLKAECADVRALPYPDGYFDLVFSNSTLDHFERSADLARAISELGRVVRTDGFLLITLDNLDNPIIALRRLLPHRMLTSLHLAPFYPGVTLNGKALRNALEAAGFTVDSQRTILHVPRVIAVKLAAVAERGPSWMGRFLKKAVLASERLEHWPTNRFSGHYVAALARKAGPAGPERRRARKPPAYKNILVPHPVSRLLPLPKQKARRLSMEEPVVIMGRGHSGTRVVAALCELLEVDMGADIKLIPSGDPTDYAFKHHLRRAATLAASNAGNDRLRNDILNLVQKAIWGYFQRLQPTAQWGWKFPECYLLGPYVAAAVPQAKFIHLLRDGRDVAFKRHLTDAPEHRLARLILKERGALKYPHNLQAAHSWAYQVEHFRKFAQNLETDRLLEQRYEDFMTHPLEEGQRLSRFLGVDMTEEFRRYLEEEIDPGRAGGFRQQPLHLVRQVEQHIGELLIKLGYDSPSGKLH